MPPILNGVCMGCGCACESTGGCYTCMNRPPPTKPHKCPVCDGAGKISRPPWIAGDQNIWADTGTALYPCQACDGSGIVWEGKP